MASRSRPIPVSMPRLGSGFRSPPRLLVELREDEVPELEVALAVAARRALGAAAPRAGPLVPVDLGAGTARALAPGGAPEVVLLVEARHARRPEADVLRPEIEGLVVLAEDRRPEPFRRHAEDLRGEFPRPLDRLFLEVVAEREVAEHLEERRVAHGEADVLDVGQAEAALDGDRAPDRRRKRGGVVRLERDHARGGEEERWVVEGDERRHRQVLVPARDEELEKRPAELVRRRRRRGLRSHPSSSSRSDSIRSRMVSQPNPRRKSPAWSRRRRSRGGRRPSRRRISSAAARARPPSVSSARSARSVSSASVRSHSARIGGGTPRRRSFVSRSRLPCGFRSSSVRRNDRTNARSSRSETRRRRSTARSTASGTYPRWIRRSAISCSVRGPRARIRSAASFAASSDAARAGGTGFGIARLRP